jgi:hypothetical protein
MSMFSRKKYAKITVEEWEGLKASLSAAIVEIAALPTKQEFDRVKDIALQANDIVVGIIPDAGIKAHKVGNQTVVTGMEQKKG